LKVVIFGGSGQLGSDLTIKSREMGYDVFSYSRAEVDVLNKDRLAEVLGLVKPNLILNCAAFHNLDQCQDNPEMARRVNEKAVLDMKEIAPASKLVYISTNYVFSGKKPLNAGGYLEDDRPDPAQEYGQSKLLGELAAGEDALIVRTAGLYGRKGSLSNRGNFVDKIIRRDDSIQMVADQYIIPTETCDLASAILELFEKEFVGVCHLTSLGGCSWFSFTKAILEIAGKNNQLTPRFSDLQSPVQRPLNGLLESNLDLPKMRPWQEALEIYLSSLKR